MGTQTTRSGISVILSGRVIAPRIDSDRLRTVQPADIEQEPPRGQYRLSRFGLRPAGGTHRARRFPCSFPRTDARELGERLVRVVQANRAIHPL
ncbi:Uncharacterised protein [Mycobacteroides abscessus subsp. abscessus]|nr:Uncharacterised protein [Mycobacteroides abscessus subsp. abscessus]